MKKDEKERKSDDRDGMTKRRNLKEERGEEPEDCCTPFSDRGVFDWEGATRAIMSLEKVRPRVM